MVMVAGEFTRISLSLDPLARPRVNSVTKLEVWGPAPKPVKPSNMAKTSSTTEVFLLNSGEYMDVLEVGLKALG